MASARPLSADSAIDADAATLLLSPVDVARELRVSVRSLRRLIMAGRIPAPLRIGRALRWRRADLVAWLAAGAPAQD